MNQEDFKSAIYPGTVPTSPVIWPAPAQRSNQIQQVKITAQPQLTAALPTTQPSQAVVPPRTTPAQVSRIRVVSKTVGDSKTLTIKFTHPAGNHYFQAAAVYLRKGKDQPVLVAGGSKSPLSFTVPKSNAPHSIYVVSQGNWGSTNILTSPSTRVKLG
jgi:hypothetical protein